MNFKSLHIPVVLLIAALTVPALAQEPATTPQAPAAAPAATSGMSASDMVKKFTQHYDNKDESAQSQMILMAQSGSQQTRDMDTKKMTGSDNLDKILIRFRAPPDIRGTGLLTWEQSGSKDDLQWIYLPAIRKSKQISGGDKSDKFVGSDFTYEDLRPEKLEDNNYTLVQEDAHWALIDATPKSQDSAYSRRRMLLRKDIFFITSVDYYDKSGKLVKKMKAEDLADVGGGMWRANKITMQDLGSGHSTVINITNRQLNTGLSESDFSKQALERG